METISGVIRQAVSKTEECRLPIGELVFGGGTPTRVAGTISVLELTLNGDDGKIRQLKFMGNSNVQKGDTIQAHLSEKNKLSKNEKDDVLYIEKYVDGDLVRTDYSTNYKQPQPLRI